MPADAPPAASKRFRPWMKIALAVAAVCLLGAGGYYVVTAPKMPRPAPRLDQGHLVSGLRLRKPPNVTPTEEHPGPDGETIYLTYEQFKAANAARTLPTPGYDRKLARIFSERDPEARAEQAAALIKAAPADETGDAEVYGLYALTYGVLTSPPQSPRQVEARKSVEALVGCRFIPIKQVAMPVPKCPSPPTMTPAYVMLGVGAAPLLIVLGALALGRRTRSAPRRAAAPAA